MQVITRHGGRPRAGRSSRAAAAATCARRRGDRRARPARWRGAAARRALRSTDGFTGTARDRRDGRATTTTASQAVGDRSGWQHAGGGAASAGTVALRSTTTADSRVRSAPIPSARFAGVDRDLARPQRTIAGGRRPARSRGRALAAACANAPSSTYGDCDAEFASPFGPSECETRRAARPRQTDIASATSARLGGLEGHGERGAQHLHHRRGVRRCPIERADRSASSARCAGSSATAVA